MKKIYAILLLGALCLGCTSHSFAKTRMTPQARAAQKRAKKQQKAMKKFSKQQTKHHKAASKH